MAAAATSSEHQAAAIDEQWHELQRSDRWTVSAAVAAAARANPPRSQRHDTRALRWRPHEPHELEAMSAWADLQAAETSLAVAWLLDRHLVWHVWHMARRRPPPICLATVI